MNGFADKFLLARKKRTTDPEVHKSELYFQKRIHPSPSKPKRRLKNQSFSNIIL
jgi:hypothetical protein